MTDKQDNKRSMYIAVQRVCNSNNSICYNKKFLNISCTNCNFI